MYEYIGLTRAPWYNSRPDTTVTRTSTKYDVHICFSSAERSRHSDSLRAGRTADRIPVGTRFPAPVQTGHGAYPAS